MSNDNTPKKEDKKVEWKDDVAEEIQDTDAEELFKMGSEDVPYVEPEKEHQVSYKRRVTAVSTSAFRGSMSSFPVSPLDIVVEEVEEYSTDSIGFFKLFRFATAIEWIALWIGIILSAIMGFGIPISVILYGEFTTLLVDRTVAIGKSTPTNLLKLFGGGQILINATEQENYDAIKQDSIAYAASSISLTVLMLILGICAIDLLNFAALRQILKVREMLLTAVLRQDMTWYDTNTSMNFATKVTDDMEKMKDGMGEKIGMFTYLVSSFIYAVIISFTYGWKLTLVVMSSTPVIIIATAVVARVQSTLTVKELHAYGGAGMIAEEVLGAVRTVIAFGGQEKEIDRYKQKLSPATEMGSRKGLYSGIGSGVMWFIIYISYAIAFYYGVTLIFNDKHKEDKEYTPAVLMIVFFGVLAGAQNLGLTSPHLDAFNAARGSASTIFSILDHKSDIDSLSDEGIEPNSFVGDIVFENVHFQYPSRPNIKILRGLNLRIPAGKTVALVGPSGCGKSTTIQLLQRMYSPAVGKVTLDGVDIKDLKVKWLRQQIGVVSQEPILFATSIIENIRYGNPASSQRDIVAAARSANCHDFISKLPEGYDTLVGERGAQLSGGQKQRIAIARALLRKPLLLLLDEATSALDLHSQAKVQEALDAAIVGRTTLVITHRLSTITNADIIVFIDKGVVIELGSHSELMALKDNYYKLVMAEVPDSATDDKVDRPLPEEERVVMSRKSVYARASRASMRVSFASGIPSTDSLTSSMGSLDDESLAKSADFCRIMALNGPEWYLIVFGCIASLFLGATLPAFAFVFGDIYGVLSLDDRDAVLGSTLMFSMWFLVIGIVTGFSTFVQMLVFSVSGARMTSRLRSKTFEAMLRQEMGWYDDDTNSIGALSARLAGDCGAVQGATGLRIASLLQAGSCLAIGIIMALIFSWKMTLVSATTVPIILGAVFMESAIMAGEGMREKVAMENATKIATEAISNIKTVASLGQEEAFLNRYMMEINEAAKMARTKTRLRGFVFSLGQCVPFFGYAISLSYGGHLVAEKEMEYKNVIKVSEALIFGSWMLGQALAFAPNFNSAKLSAARLFMLFDRKPRVVSSPNCQPLENWRAEGDITYKKVEFSYPTRPGIEILRGFDLKIEKGKTIALVGHSGCGKSTCVQLIQRLYDPTWGTVSLDSMDIVETIPLDRLRAQLGLVSQEPVLFDRSIAENIAYGDNMREVPMYEIVSAAKQANIHNFVRALPLGYETRLGSKGTQLSGGQKQRIAIARALVRNPRVLLLDEATSALDTQSEKMVQEALDKAGAGRTCIVIAHRLSTIRNAHMICVVERGRIAESGTHEELIEKDGLYAKLHAMQRMAV